MKKLLLVISILVIAVLESRSQIKIYDTYQDKYPIAISEDKEGFEVYLSVNCSSNNNVGMNLTKKEISCLHDSIVAMKAKYLKWIQVAKENNVTSMDKIVGVQGYYKCYFHYGSKYRFDLGARLRWRLIIIDGGVDSKPIYAMCLESDELTDHNNEYITCKSLSIDFINEDRFDELIKKLDPDNIEKFLKKENKVDDLFK